MEKNQKVQNNKHIKYKWTGQFEDLFRNLATFHLQAINILEHNKVELKQDRKNIPGKSYKDESGIATLRISGKDFKAKSINDNEEEHYILIKVSTHQEDISILNLYRFNKIASK